MITNLLIFSVYFGRLISIIPSLIKYKMQLYGQIGTDDANNMWLLPYSTNINFIHCECLEMWAARKKVNHIRERKQQVRIVLCGVVTSLALRREATCSLFDVQKTTERSLLLANKHSTFGAWYTTLLNVI